MPRPLSPKHAAIVDALTEGLGEVDTVRTYDRSPGVVPPIDVEIIEPARYPDVMLSDVVGVTRFRKGEGFRLITDPSIELVRMRWGWVPLVYERGDVTRIAACVTYWGINDLFEHHAEVVPDLAEAFLDEVRATQWPLVITRRV